MSGVWQAVAVALAVAAACGWLVEVLATTFLDPRFGRRPTRRAVCTSYAGLVLSTLAAVAIVFYAGPPT